MFMLLGAACGAVAAVLRICTALMERFFGWLTERGAPKYLFPALAGCCVAIVAANGLEEVLYRGFANVDLVLGQVDGQLRPPGAPPDGPADQVGHLAWLLLSKVVLTAVCRSSGLVGGLFAPAIFMGLATGGLVGRCLRDFLWPVLLLFGGVHAFSVPTTYAIVGMAASLAAICGVPLTAVVLLLELAGGRSYGVVLPMVVAVGVAVTVEDRAWEKMVSGLGGAPEASHAVPEACETVEKHLVPDAAVAAEVAPQRADVTDAATLSKG